MKEFVGRVTYDGTNVLPLTQLPNVGNDASSQAITASKRMACAEWKKRGAHGHRAGEIGRFGSIRAGLN